jgi:1,4-dihydroxy-2-naphthoate octaprenyltransferase
LISAAAMKRAMIVAFVVATAFGVYLASVGGWPIVAIGVASITAGIAYTGGPWPLGYHGLGDLFVFVFFGLVAVCGTAYVQLAAVPCLAVWAAVPVGALATAIIVVNNLRDRTSDVRVGKRTLAVRLGRTGALVEYALLLGASYAVSIGLAAATRDAWLLLPLISLPLAVFRIRALARAVNGPEFNACLSATGQLLLAYGVLFAVGLSL